MTAITDTATDTATPRPGDRWREGLRAAAVPEAVRGRSERTFSLEPDMFRWRPDQDAKQPPRPSRLRALEALPEGGTVLDVGVGGGASSFGLAPKAGLIIGVDRLEGMLESFEASAPTAGVAVRAVLGTWPEAVDEVDDVDVVVCHHALYGAEEIEDFLVALTGRARHRVVVEVSSRGPTDALNPLWKAIHGEERRDRVVADELEAVLAGMGLGATREDIVLPPTVREVTPQLVSFARRRLFVGEERDEEIAQLLRDLPPREHRIAALWWPGAASAGNGSGRGTAVPV